MTSELLQKEVEFHQMNAELEIRTKQLMHEVDSVMKMQNSIAIDTKQNSNRTKCKVDNNYKNTNYESGDHWANYEDDNKKTVSGLSQCLKTKIIMLQTELDEFKLQYKNKCNELKLLQGDYSKLDEDKTKWQQLLQMQKGQKEKSSNQNVILTSKLQTKDTELTSLRKENESLKKDLKISTMNTANVEIKLNKLLEETEKAKTNLKNIKQEEKEIRDNHRKQMNELTSVNKKLEKQVTELTNGFKKQMSLVDNLRKQKMYLESAKLMSITEEDFTRLLDWKPSESE